MRPITATVALLFAGWLGASPFNAHACRYNVRDVGFVDFESEAYHLFVWIGNRTPAETLDALHKTAQTTFRDANVLFEVVNVDTHPTHPSLSHRPLSVTPNLPSTALVPPDAAPIEVTLFKPNGTLRPDFAETLAGLISSPTRNALQTSVAKAFGTILLIEGLNPAANQTARRTIADAIEQIRGHMKSLPKVIAEPPALEVLEASSLARERTLLRILPLDTQPTSHARAAVFYGRSRWIGPLMNGEEIAVRNLVGLFSMIGADCEFDLDLGWTLGTRLPLRWPETMHAPLAKSLGFDPENPLIKMEISTLVNRRGTIRPNSPSPGVAPHAAPTATAVHPSSTESPARLEAHAPNPTPSIPQDPDSDSRVYNPRSSDWVWLSLSLGGLGVGALAFVLLVRARRLGRLD